MTVDEELVPSTPSELAYYYPSSYWREGATSDWAKTLLLFFDGVATLVPEHERQAALDADPAVAGHLVDRGLLRMISTDELMWQWNHSASIYDMLVEYIRAVAPFIPPEPFVPSDVPHVLHTSKLPAVLVDELETQGLARTAGFPESGQVQVHPEVWRIVLTSIADYVSQHSWPEISAYLLPVTDQSSCTRVVSQHIAARRAAVVASDLQQVSVNLAAVPLEEVLDFRDQYGADFRAYRRGLNQFVMALAKASPEERRILRIYREEHLADLNNELRNRSRLVSRGRAFTPFLLGMVGGVMQVTSGDVLGGSGGMVGSLGALPSANSVERHEFSYLFRAVKEAVFMPCVTPTVQSGEMRMPFSTSKPCPSAAGSRYPVRHLRPGTGSLR